MQQERAPRVSVGGASEVVVHAHIFCPPSKTGASVDTRGQVDNSLRAASESPGRREQAAILEFAGSLGQARDAALAQLQREGAADGGTSTETAATKYLSLLLGLINRQQGPSAEASPAADQPGAAPAIAADAQLRRAATFGWEDVLVTSRQASSAADSVFELASFLVAWGLWQMRCASSLCQPSRAGVSADTAAAVGPLASCSACKAAFPEKSLRGPAFVCPTLCFTEILLLNSLCLLSFFAEQATVPDLSVCAYCVTEPQGYISAYSLP